MLVADVTTGVDFSIARESVVPIYETVSRSHGFSFQFEVPNEVTLKAMAEAEEIQNRPGFADLDSFLGALERDEGV